MEENNNILGCFVSGPASYHDDDAETKEMRLRKAEVFRNFIWGEHGVDGKIKLLKRNNYGHDFQLILFQFHLLPLLEELAYLKDIERYRPKERAIGIPIIIHDENFFNRSHLERWRFIKNTILERLDLLARVVKRNKLDTDIGQLKADVARVLS